MINNIAVRSTEKMFQSLDEVTKQQVLSLRTVNRKASEVTAGSIMNWEGTRRLDDMDARSAACSWV